MQRRSLLFGLAGAAIAAGGSGSALTLKKLLDYRREANRLAAQVRLIESQFGLEPSPEDARITTTFAYQADRYPSLKTVRRSVGLMRLKGVEGTNGRNMGTAIVLDDFGTICMSAHQLKHKNDGFEVQFFPEEGLTCTVPAEPPYHHNYFDVGFAKIDPAIVARHEVIPITFGNPENIEILREGFFSLGFPTILDPPRLHSVLCVFEENDTDTYMKELPGKCRLVAKGTVFRGHSGGPAFVNGACYGISSGSGLLTPGSFPSSYFISIEVIQALYCKLFPVEARNTGIPNFDLSALRPECNPAIGEVVRLGPHLP